MQKMVSFLLVAVMVVATLPHAESVNCYTCAGYDPKLPDDKVNNNKNCPQDNFKASAISYTRGEVCGTLMEELNGYGVTVRGPIDTPRMARGGDNVLRVKGYYCATNLCNDMDPSAAPLSRAFSLPLLLLSLLAALSRCLA